MPFPGDDQGSIIYSTLSSIEASAADALQKAQKAADGSVEPSTSGRGDEPTASSNGIMPDPKKKPPVPHRWVIVGAMALAFVLCNMDKVNMSVAVIPMAAELGWSPSDRGLVSSAFFWGYSLTQIPAGWISTRIGGAKVLLAGVALWSLGTLVAPPAAHFSLLALCASRVFVGLGEGLAPSSATNVMAKLVPERERARAVTAVFGSLDVGSVIGLLVCGPLIRSFGWPSVFYLFALLGLLWCLAWPLLKPEEADTSVPYSAPPATVSDKAVPWGVFLSSKPVWAIIVAHFCYNWGYYTLLAWLPSFFELSLGLTVESSSLLTLIPYLAMTAMTPFVGPVADGLVSRGWSVTDVRKLAQGVAFAGPALCMIMCSLLTPHGTAHAPGAMPTAAIVGLFSIAFAMGAWARAGLYCNHQDLSPEYAGALLGLSNTAGALPGILGVTSVGFLLEKTQNWGASLFYPTAACQIFGLIIYTIFASSKRQDWATR
ncbi:hypothetical protein WJX75_008641 [Coccomyxa subellipsoidea]|uniref:Major facilitator superfamily (MFS) profile domain-containing protein n=1 Tax=Coccomyxa subellipsoidea TaxID=248742 RepID=A0ABR2YYT8_9CHLO